MLDDLIFTLQSLLHHVLRWAGLRHKRPYRVRVVGEPLWMTTTDGKMDKNGGFYTTRIVLARSRQEAIDSVIATVEREAVSFAENPSDLPLEVQVDACVELKGCVTTQGGGFSFWVGDPKLWEWFGSD